MLFEVNGVGRLARDVEIRYSQSGSAIGKFSIVSSEKFKSQTGEQKENVCFVDCVMFGRSAEIANQFLRKGSKIMIRGVLQLEQWTDQTTQAKRSKHSVKVEKFEMLDPKPDAGNGGNYQPEQGHSNPNPQPTPTPIRGHEGAGANSTIPQIDINEDEIPF